MIAPIPTTACCTAAIMVPCGRPRAKGVDGFPYSVSTQSTGNPSKPFARGRPHGTIMAAVQQAVVGMGAIIGSAVLFTWSSGAGDVKALEKQRSLRHYASGKYVDGDEELIKKLPSRSLSIATPQSPEQIMKLQTLRRESTGKY
eukprot:Transcript_22475.p2 GENE.Transcript_22475~~Transcript_22475.p2  ORF type:complete len:144 (-),score=29.03 Transcript_22475:210-641(-)